MYSCSRTRQVSTYQHIAQRQAQVPVRQLCQVLRVAPAAYYAWHRRRQQPVVEPTWQAAVHEAFTHHSQRYGTRRLRAVAPTAGGRSSRRVPRTTDSDPAVRAAPNRLLGQPAPTAPNWVWVGDIT